MKAEDYAISAQGRPEPDIGANSWPKPDPSAPSGRVPLVPATRAGANVRASLGITVFPGVLVSTCLAVLPVSSLFVVIQRFGEWRKPEVGEAAAVLLAEHGRILQ